MKIFMGFVILTCLAFPVFSQSSDTDRFAELSGSMDAAISRSTDMLAAYDSRSSDDGDIRMYSSYKKRFDDLVRDLRESELKMAQLFRTNDRVVYIREERDNYNRLLSELQSVKAEYDGWLRTVQ